MRYFFHYFLVISTNFRHSFGNPQNETPHKHRAQPSRNALFFRSTAPLAAKCSAAPKAAANTKTACRTFPSADGLQLRQQESNLRLGSQSPLWIHLYFIVFMLFIRCIFNCSHLISHPIFVKCFFRTLLNLFSVTNYRDNQHKFLV